MAGKYVPLALIFGDIFTAARAAFFETQYKLAKERARPLGGIADVGETSTAYVDVPGVVVVRIDEETTAQVHAMGRVSGGTGSLRLADTGAGPVSITSSSVANPTVITSSVNHGLVTGDVVTIVGHTGSTPAINGSHTVTVTGPTTFTIPVNVTVGGTGGTATRTSSNLIPGSEVSFTTTVPTLQATPDLALAAGATYKLQVKISVSTEHVIVYGGALVTR